VRLAMRNQGLYLRAGGVLACLLLAPNLALAYIDPGNGAYMVQALFTLVGAALFYLRHPVRTLKESWHWLLGRFRPPKAAAHEAERQESSEISEPAEL
jgi:hypothetical protein